MIVQQHFLSTRLGPTPARWCQAFPAGHVHTLQELQSQVAQNWQGLLWLTSDEPRWQDHLLAVRQQLVGLPVVLLSSAPDTNEGLLALKSGVRGYTHAYAVVELLQEVALVVAKGGLWVGPDLLRRMVGSTTQAISKLPPSVAASTLPNAWDKLSLREAQVARLVSAGHSNKEVATTLYISERTVKAHLGSVFEKLGVRDRLQLVLCLAASPDPGTSGTPAA